MDRGIVCIVLDDMDTYGHHVLTSYDVGYRWENGEPDIYCIYSQEDIYELLVSPKEAEHLLTAIEDEICRMEAEKQADMEKDDLPNIRADEAYDRRRDEVRDDMIYEQVRESKWRE